MCIPNNSEGKKKNANVSFRLSCFLFTFLRALDQGEEGNPLVIKGTREAVISAFSGDRLLMWDQKVVDIRHSWITLEVK